MDVYQRRRLVALSAIAAIFIVFVLLVRSCGGDDEPTTETPIAGATGASGAAGATSLSKADYIEQADQICLETNNSIAGVDVSAPTADTDLGKLVEGELQQLQSLPLPTEDTSTLDDFLSALDKQARAYKEKGTAVERGDTAAAAEIDTTLDKATGQAADAAAAFGFEVCGDTSKVSDNSSTGSDTGSTTDTGGTVTPTTETPVTPTTETPVTPAPDTGATPTAPPDTGTDSGTDSGGVSP
jgi:hypothetical protein